MTPEATARGGPAPPSRVQPLEPPAGVVAPVAEPVVQPVRAALPALDLIRGEQVSAPMFGARDVLSGEALAHLLHPALEGRPIVERPALLARPRAELRVAGPGGEVRVGVPRRELAHRPAQTDLPVAFAPVQRRGRPWVLGELAGLA